MGAVFFFFYFYFSLIRDEKCEKRFSFSFHVYSCLVFLFKILNRVINCHLK